MMKIIIMFLFGGMLTFFSFQAAHAQTTTVFLGVKGGISIPNLQSGSSGSAVSQGYSSRFGHYFGLFGQFLLTKRFSLQPEINYAAQGGKKDGQQAVPAHKFNPQAPADAYYYANYKSEAKLNYIEVPVLAKFTFPISRRVNFLIDAGPYVSFLVNAKNETSGSSKIYTDKQETQPFPISIQSFDRSTDIKDQLHHSNFGIQGGLGLSLTIGGAYAFVHIGGNYGFINIQKNKKDGENHTGAATVVIGYALEIY